MIDLPTLFRPPLPTPTKVASNPFPTPVFHYPHNRRFRCQSEVLQPVCPFGVDS